MAQKTLFAWRNCLLSPEGPSNPTTRLVLLTLSTHMSQEGERCFPTTRRLAEQTGLSERSVITHIQRATQEGWLLVSKHGTNGQGWRRHEYHPLVPQRAEGGSVPQRAERASVASVERAEPHDRNVLKEVQCNSKENSKTPSRTIPKKNGSYPVEFETIWSLYPKRTGANSKRAAFKAWQARLRSGVPEEEILDGVRRYADYCDDRGNSGTSYVKMAATFFGPDEWWKEPWGSTDDNGRPDLAVL